ncbi:MAG: glycoside hydrolase family 75 protein [Elusimicrobiota bacterium]
MKARALLLLPLLLALTGCKPEECADKKASARFDTSDPKNRPEPARFGARVETASPEALRQLEKAGKSFAVAAAPIEDMDASWRSGAVRFDGASNGTFVDALAASPTRSSPWTVRAGMAIDTDGPVSGYDPRVHQDPHRQRQTSMRYADGSSLDPTRVPYVVVPKSRKDLLGSVVVVRYNGQSALAVVGDCGPRFGEGSVALAQRLGIPSHGVSGGVGGGVTYSFQPDLRVRKPQGEGALLNALSDAGRTLQSAASAL